MLTTTTPAQLKKRLSTAIDTERRQNALTIRILAATHGHNTLEARQALADVLHDIILADACTLKEHRSMVAEMVEYLDQRAREGWEADQECSG